MSGPVAVDGPATPEGALATPVASAPLVELRGLTKRFGGVAAVDDVTADLAHTPVSAVIGANGAGKTTLFRLISGVYAPTSGTVSYDGQILGRMRPSERVRRGVAHTSQGVRLFPEMSVLENVWIGLRADRGNGSSHRTQLAAQHEEAAEFLAKVSPHLLARANDPAGELSYGDQRRVEIARTLAAKPRLLLLDEPAAGLNQRERHELTELIQELTDQDSLRIVLIEHDVPLVMQVSQHITVLHMGRFLAAGMPSFIRQDARVRSAYLGTDEARSARPAAVQPAPAATASAEVPPLLRVEGATVRYGHVTAVDNVSFSVRKGEVFALLGANGAGKSSTINMISGVTPAATGSVVLEGVGNLTGLKAHQVTAAGVCQVPEGRRIFPSLSVEENLEVAGQLRRAQLSVGDRIDNVYETFPELARMRRRRGGALSGGEQQMLAIGRAIMSDPKVLMLDEPSLGLAPMVVDRIWEFLESLRGRLTVILVEQNYVRALEIADAAAVLERGTIERQGSSTELAADPALSDLYLGAAAPGSPVRPDGDVMKEDGSECEQ